MSEPAEVYDGYRSAEDDVNPSTCMFHIWRDRVAGCGRHGLLSGKVPAFLVPEIQRCRKCKWPNDEKANES